MKDFIHQPQIRWRFAGVLDTCRREGIRVCQQPIAEERAEAVVTARATEIFQPEALFWRWNRGLGR